MAKYDEEIVKRICDNIRAGDTQKMAAQRAGIAEDTFYEWRNTKSEFCEAVKKAKDEFRETIVSKLEATLYRKAQGYEVTETETEYINDKDGKPKIKSQKKKIKHIQPETAALIFALTNLAPDKWKNRQNIIEDKREDEKPKIDLSQVPKDLLDEVAETILDAQKVNKNGGK